MNEVQQNSSIFGKPISPCIPQAAMTVYNLCLLTQCLRLSARLHLVCKPFTEANVNTHWTVLHRTVLPQILLLVLILQKVNPKNCAREYNNTVKFFCSKLLYWLNRKPNHIIEASVSEPPTSEFNISVVRCSINASWYSFSPKHCTLWIISEYRWYSTVF